MRCLLYMLLMGVVDGELLPGVDPSLPAPKPVESLPRVEAMDSELDGEDEILLKTFLGFRLESWEGGVPLEQVSPHLEIEEGLLVPSPQTLSGKLEGYLGGPLKASDLMAIGDTLLIHYDVEGYPVVGVEAPEQDFKDGWLTLLVEVGRVGRVGVTRPRYGDPEVLRDGLKLRRDDYVLRKNLDEQMAWFGRNIFRRPRLFVSPGDEPATADILIGMEEARPWRLTTGYENSGTDALGRDRLLVGAAGMTKGEHVIAWQSVVGLPMSSLNAHAVSWEIPLHHAHQTIQLNAAYARLSTRSLSSGFPVDNKGTSWSGTARHRMAIPSPVGWRQYFSSGFEVKGTDQFALFGAGSFSPGEVRFLHGRIGYELERDWEDGGLAVQASMIGSPGGLIPGNDDADFQAYDPMADSSYVVARMAAQGWWSPGGDWRIGLRGMGQLADSRLLPAEQFAAGGYQTVRGVSEREFFADEGWQSSLELLTPAWSPMAATQIRFLGFLDHAWLRNRGGSPSSITGSGVGVRLRVSRWVDLRADHGWRLDGGGGHSHVGVRFTY